MSSTNWSSGDYTTILGKLKCSQEVAGLVKLRAIAKVPGTAGRRTRYALALGNSPTIGGDQRASFEEAQALFRQTSIEGTLYSANPSIRYVGLIAAANEQRAAASCSALNEFFRVKPISCAISAVSIRPTHPHIVTHISFAHNAVE